MMTHTHQHDVQMRVEQKKQMLSCCRSNLKARRGLYMYDISGIILYMCVCMYKLATPRCPTAPPDMNQLNMMGSHRHYDHQ